MDRRNERGRLRVVEPATEDEAPAGRSLAGNRATDEVAPMPAGFRRLVAVRRQLVVPQSAGETVRRLPAPRDPGERARRDRRQDRERAIARRALDRILADAGGGDS